MRLMLAVAAVPHTVLLTVHAPCDPEVTILVSDGAVPSEVAAGEWAHVRRQVAIVVPCDADDSGNVDGDSAAMLDVDGSARLFGDAQTSVGVARAALLP